MSYNQTYGKINKSEEVEKGRFNLRQAEKQIGDAVKIIHKEAKALNNAQRELRKASNLVYGAGNFIQVLELGLEMDPKKFRSGDMRDVRAISKSLHRVSKNIEKLDESIPFVESLDYNTELINLITRIKEFNKRNR